MKTDQELKLKLAEMLPEKLAFQHQQLPTPNDSTYYYEGFFWVEDSIETDEPIKETEWLHVCWLVEQTLTHNDWLDFSDCLTKQRKPNTTYTQNERDCVSASWQQRAVALCKVKGTV